MNNDLIQDLAIEEIIRSVKYMIKDFSKNITQIYDGIVISAAQNNKWNIQYNGETHAVKLYGTNTPSIGDRVKVFIPQGNQSVAFFM